jgi:hypothetical protein
MIARGTYQVKVAFLRLHGEAVDLHRLEVARDGRPNPGSNLLVQRRLIGNLTHLEVPRRHTRAHLVHPQRLRH